MRTLRDITPLNITLSLVVCAGVEHRVPVLSTGATDGAVALVDGELARVERWDDGCYAVMPEGIPLTSGTERALMSADVYTALSAYAALQDIRQAELEDDDNASRHVLRF
jgi:hypothetical protein